MIQLTSTRNRIWWEYLMKKQAIKYSEEVSNIWSKWNPNSKTYSLTVQYIRELIKWGGGGLVTKSCPTFCDLMDHSPPGSFVHGIFQARILKYSCIVAISFSRGSSWSRDQTFRPVSPALQADSLTAETPEKP